MRISIFLILFSVIQVMATSSYSQSTKLTLNLQDVTVEQVLNEIETQSEFFFLYNQKLVDVDRKVNVDTRNKKISDILANLFQDEDVNYLVMNRQIVLSPTYIKEKADVISDQRAQEPAEVKGTIVDSEGYPVPGVNIIVKGTTKGTISDANGQYTINVDDPNAILVFSFIGMNTLEEQVGNRSIIDVTLTSGDIAIEEINIVYNTALGFKRQKRSIGYAAQQIKSEDAFLAAPVDLSQGLQGKIAGLNITQANGIGNASSRIVIRGNNSLFGGNTPLIVIDGTIVENNELEQGSSASSGYKDWGNYLSYLDMNTVDEITVLKGPNAAALYGARGANGVVLITSKKGMKRKGAGIQYNTTYTVSDVYRYADIQNEYGGGFRSSLWTANPQLPKTADGQSFPALLYPHDWHGNPYPGYTGYESSHGAIPGGYNTWDVYSWFGAGSSWGPRLDGTQALWWDGEMRSYSPQPDNREYMFRQGTEKAHNLSFSSANEFGSIRVGMTHKNGDAVIDNTNTNSTNFSLGSHVKISEIFSADINAAYNQNYRLNTPTIGGNVSWSKFMIYGMSREYVGLEKDLYKGEDGYDGYRVLFPGSYPHAEYSRDMFWDNLEFNDRLWRDEFLSTLKLNAEITPWLRAFVRTSVDLLATRFETENNTTEMDGVTGGRFNKTVTKLKTFNTDVMATLHKEDLLADGFNANFTFGYNDYSTNTAGVTGNNYSTFRVPNVYALSNYTDKLRTSMVEKRYDIQSYSYVGLLDLSYKEYLFVQVTGRQDHSSTLPVNNNSTFYPSMNSSFVFTEGLNLGGIENTLSYGALRLAWGKSANATDPYQLDNYYNTGTFGSVTTIERPAEIPPNDLTFQTSQSFETGIALGLFHNRLNIDFTYYDIQSQNQIMKSAISWASGAGKVTFNSGELRNQGVEFIVSAKAVQTRNFKWDIMWNGARNSNMVVALADGIEQQEIASVFGAYGAFMKVTAGEEYGTIYGTDFELDEQGRKQVMNVYNTDGSGEVIATHYKITDDPVAIGNASPKLTGGLTNNFRYKNFSLSALIDYKIGGDLYSIDHAVLMGSGLAPETAEARNGGGLPYTFPDGTTDDVGMIMEGYNIDDGRENDRVITPTNYYGISYAGWAHFNRPRSLSVFDNSWVKLRELSLTYNFSNKLLQKTKVIQNLSLSLFGRNLFYLYSSLPMNLNPEGIVGIGNGQGLQWSAYPSIRSVGFNLRVGF